MPRASSSSATFSCDDQVVTATYLGRRRWEVSSAGSTSAHSHEEVAHAIRARLRLEGEIPYDTRAVEVRLDRVVGTIKNNTFPTDLWFVNLGGEHPWGGAVKGLDAALTECLDALRLSASEPRTAVVVPLDRDRFSRSALELAGDRAVWARELEDALTARLAAAPDPELAVPALVEELRALGHDLWLFDESPDEFATWMYDWTKPATKLGLAIQFTFPPYEEARVDVMARDGA